MSIRLMTRVWDETRFKGTELLVLLCLADHANDEGYCWPSYKRIAKRARCTPRQAMRCVSRLMAEGWVSKAGKKRVPRGFLNVLYVGPTGDSGVTGDISSHTGDIFDVPQVTPMSPKPSYETSLREPVLGLHRASEISSEGIPEQEELEAFVCENTGMDFSHCSMCVEAWLKGTKDMRIVNWQAHLGAFADKYECDYRG